VSWAGFGAALVSILWPYHGWMNIAPVAEEVREPGRNIPLALIIGTLTVMVLYVSVNVTYALVIPHDAMLELQGTNVAAEMCRRLLGPAGLVAASAVVMISVFGALNGNLLVGPRLLYAMAHDGLAPARLGELHPRFRTPAFATVVLMCWSVLLVVVSAIVVEFQEPLGLPARINVFDLLTDYAMFGAIAFETLAVASIFPLRRQYPAGQVPLPYRCRGYPWLPAIYVLAWAAVLANMFVTKRTESLFGLGFVAAGALFYVWKFGRHTPVILTAESPGTAVPGLSRQG
jgi:basic amino acid/polyamine antiporter, APA family